MMRKTLKAILLLLVVYFFNLSSSFAQDSSRLRISLLTCSPGEELYSIFGHSAVRIIDSNSVTDYIYNFGTFDFDQDEFYLKFMRGKLLYFVSAERTDDFINAYAYEKRGITEQVLNLSATEKKKMQQALNENLKEENRFYKYDFFLDNCTTRLRDLISNNKTTTPILPAVMPQQTTYRQAIHRYLEKGDQRWSELGIDILLGARTDKIMSASEQQFLPDNLMYTIDSCKNIAMVKEKSVLYSPLNETEKVALFSPLNCFLILLIFIFGIGFIKHPLAQKFLNTFDVLFFIATGLIGVLLILMWVATDHSMTKNNLNLFWALPTNLWVAFQLNNNRRWILSYLRVVVVISSLLLVFWRFLPQEFNTSLIPIVILILWRCSNRVKNSQTPFNAQ
jgi:hypothetical protein